MDILEQLTALVKIHGFSMEYLESIPPYEVELITVTVMKLNEDAANK